jgi:3-dehydroquinate dehydratase-2
MSGRKRIEVLHGVNLDQLGRRDPELYGTFTLDDLETRVRREASEMGWAVSFWQTNHEGEYCEMLHLARERTDGLILNPGAWTHYSYAIRDALEVCGLPAVEVHISEVDNREDWRRLSVIRDLCVGRIQGRGAEGYRDALELLRKELSE